MCNTELGRLVYRIENRPSYIDHVVLNGGLKTILVKTTKGFYELHDGEWNKLSANEAEIECTKHYKPNAFKDLK